MMTEKKGELENWKKSHQATLIIVLIQFIATCCLIIFGWFWASFADNSVSSRAISMLWVLIILLVISSFVLRRFLFSQKHLKTNSSMANLLRTLQNNTVILNLIGFIIGILGFLITTLSGNKFEILRAGAAALLVFFMNFPRKEFWQQIVKRLE